MNRVKRGVLVGDAYQDQCAQSWPDAGFVPYSINSKAELKSRPELYDLAAKLGVTILPFDRDASAITNRPHVYLRDMFNALATTGATRFAITNADIILDPKVGSMTEAMPFGSFIIEKRRDVELITTAGTDYEHGLDFFATDMQAALELPDIGLIFGVPWWDHYFPLQLGFSGQKRMPIVGGLLKHLKHEDRWDISLWRLFGRHFLSQLYGQMISRNPVARYWTKQVGNQLITRFDSLDGISHANIQTLVCWDWQPKRRKFTERINPYVGV